MGEDSKRVLIVDDEEMIRNVVVRIMKIKGYETREAENGSLAKELLVDDNAFDYILLDLIMPGNISGDELFYHIREVYPNIEVIVSTGFIDQERKENFLEAGAKAILEKPYKIDEILSLVE